MADTATTTTEALFDNPEFAEHFTNWQRARMHLDERADAFSDGVANDFGEIKSSGPESTIDYIIEMEIEDFDNPDNFYRETVSAETLARHDQRVEANNELKIVRGELLSVSRQFGANQFVLWGLGNFLRKDAPEYTRGAILEKVKTAEENLTRVDRFARDNVGEVVTVIDRLSGFTAARLGEGGLSVDARNAHFRVAEGTVAYTMATYLDIDDMYEEEGIFMRNHDVAGSDNEFIDPVEALNRYKYKDSSLLFIVGEIPEGPVRIPTTEFATYCHTAIQRTRQVNQLALATPTT